jgi:hypothetical protein
MTVFVDPRSNHEPPPRVSREPAAHGDELRRLLTLCHAGRVYEVERWIQEGQPIQALAYKRPKKPSVLSPLRVSIRRKHDDLVLLLLCNGYRLDLEQEDSRSALDEALEAGAFDILELLLKWGADPTKVRPDNVLESYRTDLIDRFWRLGVDYTADSGFVGYLAHTVNKPLYGWLRRNRSDQRLQDALDMALLEAVTEDEEKPVSLLLWAGADPHRKVPGAYAWGAPDAWDPEWVDSSAEEAIVYGRLRMFDRLRVKELPNLGELAARAHDTATLKATVALSPPADWSGVILAFIRKIGWRHGLGSWDAQDALRFVASAGGRLTAVATEDLRYLRRELLDAPQDESFMWLIKWLKKEKNCDPIVYQELIRTPAMRQKLEALAAGTRYLSPSQKMSRANERQRRAAEQRRTAAARKGNVSGAVDSGDMR